MLGREERNEAETAEMASAFLHMRKRRPWLYQP